MADENTGWIVAAVTTLTTFLTGGFALATQKSKGNVEESVAVRTQWENLTGRLSDRLKDTEDRLSSVEKEFNSYRLEMTNHITEIENRHAEQIRIIRAAHDRDIRERDELIRSLNAMIIQNSHSTAQLLSDPAGAAMTNTAARIRDENKG